jgi:hypothetical protein
MLAPWWLIPTLPPAQYWSTFFYWLAFVAACGGSIAMAIVQLNPEKRRQFEQLLASEQQKDDERTMEWASIALEAQEKQREREAQYEQMREELQSDEVKQAFRDHLLRTGHLPTDQELNHMRERYRKRQSQHAEQGQEGSKVQRQ